MNILDKIVEQKKMEVAKLPARIIAAGGRAGLRELRARGQVAGVPSGNAQGQTGVESGFLA